MQSDVNVGVQACPSCDEVAVQTIRNAKEVCVQVMPKSKNARNQVTPRTISIGTCVSEFKPHTKW